MNETGADLVRQLLELPPMVRADGTRDRVTVTAIKDFTRTAERVNVYNWLRGKYDPQPQHLGRLKQMLALEKAKRAEHAQPNIIQQSRQLVKSA